MPDTITLVFNEITNDPLVRSYSGMTDQQVVDSLNTVDRTTNKASMTASAVMNAIDTSEFNALSAADRQRIWDILHVGELNPFGVEATLFTNVFGGGSTTITTLAADRVNNVSRAQELGIGVAKLGHVVQARRL